LNKIKIFLENNYLFIIIFVFLLFVMNMCSNRSAIKNSNIELQAVKDSLGILSNRINNIPSRQQFKIDNQVLMYEFLQFEDDLDKGKISLSELKLRLEDMRKK